MRCSLPDNQQLVLRDRKTFLESWAFMRRLAQMAEKEKLNEESPTRESLEYYRMLIMSQAKIQDVMTQSTVEPAEAVKFYDANKERVQTGELKGHLCRLLGFSGARQQSADGGTGPRQG